MLIKGASFLLETPAEHANSSPTFAKSSFFCAHQRIYIALYDERQAERMAKHALNVKYVVVSNKSMLRERHDLRVQEEDFRKVSLVDIYKFNQMANQVARRNVDCKLVFSAGCETKRQIKVVFLIGCHLLLSQGLDADQTCNILAGFQELFAHDGNNQVNALDCWRALHRAASVSWIDFREHLNNECDEDHTINMEEFIHYSR